MVNHAISMIHMLVLGQEKNAVVFRNADDKKKIFTRAAAKFF